MIKKVISFIDENKLIEKGDKILVALSGGPDSVCMLHLLNSIKDIFNIELFAAHVNHMLREEESNKDEAYANELCESLGIKIFSTRINIEDLAKERGISEEMAGRDARYEYFNPKTGQRELSKWIEILGAGMIHPNVLKMGGIDPEE